MPPKKKSIDNPVDEPNLNSDVVDENLDTPENPNTDVLPTESKDYTVDFVDEHLDDASEENQEKRSLRKL